MKDTFRCPKRFFRLIYVDQRTQAAGRSVIETYQGKKKNESLSMIGNGERDRAQQSSGLAQGDNLSSLLSAL